MFKKFVLGLRLSGGPGLPGTPRNPIGVDLTMFQNYVLVT